MNTSENINETNIENLLLNINYKLDNLERQNKEFNNKLDTLEKEIKDLKQGKSSKEQFNQKPNKDNLYYFYIVSDSIKIDYFKIGITNNIKSRLSSIQTGNPNKVYLIDFLVGNKNEIVKLEKTLKEKMSDYNLSGEWFQLKDEARMKLFNWLNEVKLNKNKLKDILDIDISKKDNEIKNIKLNNKKKTHSDLQLLLNDLEIPSFDYLIGMPIKNIYKHYKSKKLGKMKRPEFESELKKLGFKNARIVFNDLNGKEKRKQGILQKKTDKKLNTKIFLKLKEIINKNKHNNLNFDFGLTPESFNDYNIDVFNVFKNEICDEIKKIKQP